MGYHQIPLEILLCADLQGPLNRDVDWLSVAAPAQWLSSHAPYVDFIKINYIKNSVSQLGSPRSTRSSVPGRLHRRARPSHRQPCGPRRAGRRSGKGSDLGNTHSLSGRLVAPT